MKRFVFQSIINFRLERNLSHEKKSKKSILDFLIRRRYSIHTCEEEKYNKSICDQHIGDWKELSPSEEKEFGKAKYTYMNYKNLSSRFEQNKEYYVTDTKYYGQILTRLSPFNHTMDGEAYETIFSDKNYFERLFPDVRFPKAIVRRIRGNYYDENYSPVSFQEASDKLSSYQKVVFKKSVDAFFGNGIMPAEGDQITKLLSDYGSDFVVQEIIQQHEWFAYYNSSSVNIIRVITAFWKGHAYYLDSRFRIGSPGSFCDHKGANGINPLAIQVKEGGELVGDFYDDLAGAYTPDCFGKPRQGVVPKFDEMVEIALKGQKQYPMYGILGWDFTVDQDGTIICVEVNSRAPGIRAAQCMDGPLFMKETVDGNPLLDEILEEPNPTNLFRVF